MLLRYWVLFMKEMCHFVATNIMTKENAIKRSLYGRSLCSVRLFQSVVPSSIPQLTSHALFPAFGRAYASTIPLHFVTVICSLNAPFHSAKNSLIRFTAFQPFYVCRPRFFQRLLLRTAIGFGSASFLLRFPFFGNHFP
jgi:hypothetical protein